MRGLPTSQASADLARSLSIPLTTFEEVDSIDVTVDGADEIDPRCDLIKGYGGALVREKIVAAASKKFVVLAGPEKLVSAVGAAANCRSRCCRSPWRSAGGASGPWDLCRNCA